VKRLLVVLVAIVTAACAIVAPLQGQAPSDLLAQGERAYGDLEFDAAVGFLRRALESDAGIPLEGDDRAQALIYLAASEVFGADPDTAAAVFRRLILFDTRYVPNQLVFPPQVTNLYDAVRRDTKTITVEIPDNTLLQGGTEQLSLRLFASSYHDVRAVLRDENAVVVRRLYSGPIVDSLDVRWDARGTDRMLVSTGLHELTITSLDSAGRVVRSVEIPLDIRVTIADTLPHPLAPADSIMLPERESSGPGVEALAGGLLVGAALAVIPGAMSDSDLLSGRVVVAGTVSVAGIAAFFMRRPGNEITANVEANRAMWSAWQDEIEAVVRDNDARKADIRVSIRAGSPTVTEPAGR